METDQANAPQSDPSVPVGNSRRRFLGLGAILAAVGVAKTIASDAAHATTGAMQFGAVNNAGTAQTLLSSTASNTLVVDNVNGIAISGNNTHDSNSAIVGSNFSSSMGAFASGVYGVASAGRGVHALCYGTGVALLARSNGTSGAAMESIVEYNANAAANATFTHEGLGHGIVVSLNNAATTSYAISASTSGTASAISANGLTQARGIKIRSQVAHLWLVPAAASSHPASGKVGDLFVDKTKRLWFCKGATSWVLLA